MTKEGERKLYKLARKAGLDVRRVPRSQAPARAAEYADLIMGPFLVEEKTTSRRTLPVADWFQKLRREAGRMAKYPLIYIHHEELGDLVIMDSYVMIKLLKT